jgi:hypothetical protein
LDFEAFEIFPQLAFWKYNKKCPKSHLYYSISDKLNVPWEELCGATTLPKLAVNSQKCAGLCHRSYLHLMSSTQVARVSGTDRWEKFPGEPCKGFRQCHHWQLPSLETQVSL